VKDKKVVIVGAGPAGIATAIQLKRYNIEPVLLEKNETGGLLRIANLVENYPGFPDGIRGPELVELFKKQLAKNGIKVHYEEVLELDYKDNFIIKTDHRILKSHIAVIASGTKAKKSALHPVSEEIENNIFYEVHPISGVSHKKIVIAGAGDAAFDYALNLSQKNQVILINRSSRIKCIPLLFDRCQKSARILYSSNITITKIIRQNTGLLLTCVNRENQQENNINADYVIFAIGRKPNLDFLGKRLKEYYENLLKTGLLYTVGDIKNDIYRQTAICAGNGIKAAMKIYKAMEKQKE